MPLLPSRYEDLEPAFRGRLLPDRGLLEAVNRAYRGIDMSGGIRFLPIFGESGSGKSCAAMEIGNHLPDILVLRLPREAVEDGQVLRHHLADTRARNRSIRMIVAVVDQYEEAVADRQAVPTQFVEQLSLLDREDLSGSKLLFIWLTTSRDFQAQLSAATSRNRRILLEADFELAGPTRDSWPEIIEDTFSFHNHETPMADFGVIGADLTEISNNPEFLTIGHAIEKSGELIARNSDGLQNISVYQIVMLWPVTDGLRIQRVTGFSKAREGYKLDWDSWYRELNRDDREQLPLQEYNRARLYFDMRLVPIAAADLQPLCRHLEHDDEALHHTYLERFKSTHLFSVLSEQWDPDHYRPLRERVSNRATSARDWYHTVNDQPTQIGRRLARVISSCGYEAAHEREVLTRHGRVVADVHMERPGSARSRVLVELKCYADDNTMPSTIKEAVKTTLRKYSQLAGFVARQ